VYINIFLLSVLFSYSLHLLSLLQCFILFIIQDPLCDWCEKNNIMPILDALKGMEFADPNEFRELTDEDVC
jgi:hypothetical protein